jgi:hypothetical protein
MKQPAPGAPSEPGALRFMTSWYGRTIFCVLVIAIAICVYLPGLRGGFALDDYTNVVNNAAIAISNLGWDSLVHAMFSFQAGPAMRPLSMLSFALNAYFTGPEGSLAFKATNLAIHISNAALVLLLLSKLLGAYRRPRGLEDDSGGYPWLALVACAVWLLHPLNVMPVLYVVQRETALSSFFVLLGLNLYVIARQRQLTGKTGGALALWFGVPTLTALAVLCKESGALLPVYALCIEAFFFRFQRRGGGFERSVALFYGVFLLLPGCLGLAWAVFSHGGGVLNYSGRDFTLGERVLTESRVVWLYIRWTLWPDPRDLGLYHDDIAVSHGLLQPATTLLALLGIAALIAACFALRRRLPLVAFGVAWFLGGQLMESTIFPLELAYEHRCYLPDLGIIIAVLSLLLPVSRTSPLALVRYAFIAVLLGVCATLTWVRAYDWRDNLSFAAAEARHHPLSPYATYMLGQTYANLALMEDPKQYDNAVASLKQASAAPNSTIIPDVSLVLVQAQLGGKVDGDVLPRIARKMGERKIAASDIQGLAALVECVDKKNCELPSKDMQAIFDSALANPNLAELRDAHANILVLDGNFTTSEGHDLHKARQLMVEAATLVPDEAQYRENIVTMDIGMADRELARRDLEDLRKLNYLGHLDPVIADLQKQIDDLPAAGAPR